MAAPPISAFVLWFFRRTVRRYFRRHFSAVRFSKASNLSSLSAERLIVYGNHGSWWDPMVQVLLASRMMRKRRHYAPMDAAALARYAIFKHIGVFGVDLNSARAGAQFVRTGKAIVEGGGVLWVTPQGRFADVRERPLGFRPGLAGLAAKVKGGCTVLPLAIEYVFWDERLPETLLRFGDPVHIDGGDTSEIQQQLESALQSTMEALRTEGVARDPDAFSILLRGTVGTGGFYELGQRVSARLRGQRYQPAHGSVHSDQRA